MVNQKIEWFIQKEISFSFWNSNLYHKKTRREWTRKKHIIYVYIKNSLTNESLNNFNFVYKELEQEELEGKEDEEDEEDQEENNEENQNYLTPVENTNKENFQNNNI